MSTDVTRKTVTSSIDGIKIYAEAVGNPSNPAIVWIHGNSTSSGVWDNQFYNEKLQKSFYQIRFDLRGHGLSETPPEDAEAPFDNEKQASDVEAVLKEFSVTKAILVGWSYGALIPADFISVHGTEKVRALVVVDGLTGPLPEVHKYFTHGPFPGFTENGDATKMHKAYNLFIRALTHQPLSREWTLRLKGMLTETDTSTRGWVFKRKKDWGPYLATAAKSVPKLVVFGKQDGMNSLEYVDYIKGKWEASIFTSKFIDNAGHASFLEQPDEFSTIIHDWAKSITKE